MSWEWRTQPEMLTFTPTTTSRLQRWRYFVKDSICIEPLQPLPIMAFLSADGAGPKSFSCCQMRIEWWFSQNKKLQLRWHRLHGFRSWFQVSFKYSLFVCKLDVHFVFLVPLEVISLKQIPICSTCLKERKDLFSLRQLLCQFKSCKMVSLNFEWIMLLYVSYQNIHSAKKQSWNF